MEAEEEEEVEGEEACRAQIRHKVCDHRHTKYIIELSWKSIYIIYSYTINNNVHKEVIF